MRKNLVVLIILILTSKFLNGQTSVYYPFPDSNIIWVQSEIYATNYSSIDTCFLHTDFNLYIAGDTASGSFTYHKIYANWHRWGDSCPPAAYDAYGMYMYAFRQDIPNKKVYLLYDGTDKLAYDFDLNVGDTLNTLFIGNTNYVQSIDSILVAGQYRKRFWLNHNGTSNYAALIEGVGTTFGVFVPVSSNPIIKNSLSCVKVNEEVIWTDSSENTCSLTSNAELFSVSNKIRIYPNPFTDVTTISTTGSLTGATIAIYNICGQRLKEIKRVEEQPIELQRDNLPNGIYFIRIEQKGKPVYTLKLIAN